MADAPAQPRIAVVIPTRDRESRLAFALEALAAQTLPPEEFEVVVVRAPDAPGPFAAAPEGLPVRFLRAARPAGPAVQRNLGWRSTGAPLVAFTDDDCRPARDWLERLLTAADGTAAVVQGRTVPDPEEAHLLFGLARSMEIDGPTSWYETCNIAYPRELLDRLGGFDESFPTAWGEDSDLGLRARESGAESVYAGDAVVRHAVVPRTLPTAVSEALRRDSLPLVLARHPEQRREVFARLFVRRTDAELLLALPAALLARRHPLLAAALATPYLADHLAHHLTHNALGPRGLARFALHMPARLAVDLAGLAATVRGAIRHRTLAL